MSIQGRALLLGLALACPAVLPAQQVADPDFEPPIDTPEYQAGQGPEVIIDAAHLNFHTADGGYAAFARLLRRDGYDVASNTKPFTAESLAGVDILVIANAMHEQSEADWAPCPTSPLFRKQRLPRSRAGCEPAARCC